MVVKVVGRGCNDYFQMVESVKKIARNRNIEIVEVNSDSEIAKMGIHYLPALVVDDQVCCQGVGIKQEEIAKLLAV